MGIAMMVAWALVVALVIWLLRSRKTTRGELLPGGHRTAGDILEGGIPAAS